MILMHFAPGDSWPPHRALKSFNAQLAVDYPLRVPQMKERYTGFDSQECKYSKYEFLFLGELCI